MKGIIFQPELVGVLLQRGRIQTRRIVKPQPDSGGLRWNAVVVGRHGGWTDMHGNPCPCPYGAVGDRLYLKEAWRTAKSMDKLSPAQIAASCLDAGYDEPWTPMIYEADGRRRDWDRDLYNINGPGRLRNARFMPQWASRAIVEIVNVDVARLGDMRESDAVRCGVEPFGGMCPEGRQHLTNYRTLWDSINAKRGYGWDSNPWVWVLDLKAVTV